MGKTLPLAPLSSPVSQTLKRNTNRRKEEGGGGDGVGVGDMRGARGGGRAAPHAGAARVDRGEGAPERAACGGGAVRGAVPLWGARAPEDEVPPLPPQAHEHQALARPHPLPIPRQDPVAHCARDDPPQDQARGGRARQAQGLRGRAPSLRQDKAHGHPRRTQGIEASAGSQVLPLGPPLQRGRMEPLRHHQGIGGEEKAEGPSCL